MTGATKFTFDTVFEEAKDVVSEEARTRRKKTLTEGEIEMLESRAREEGMQAAEARALEAIAAGSLQAASSVMQALTKATEELEHLRASAVDVALATARKLAQTALAAFPEGEVEAALREAMHQAIGEPRLVLRTSPRVAEAVSAKIAEIAHDEGFDGRVLVTPEANFHGADCRIEWRGGGTERAEAAIEAALTQLLARRFSESSKKVTED